tara:strand:+ start:10837 stop:11907 length:1071 start_codon:yes stop_codon:yes gene_type:complete
MKKPDHSALIYHHLVKSKFLGKPGAWVLVDGQFGSTGKGLAASVLAQHLWDKPSFVTSNAGPNSGHTFYYGSERVVLQQLPSFAVAAQRWGKSPPVFMNAGAIIDPERFEQECREYFPGDPFRVWLHSSAAIVDDEARRMEQSLVMKVGSTGKGTGAALARKILRTTGAVAADREFENCVKGKPAVLNAHLRTIFVEVSQGYSLSLNASGMYPYTTSRDCTVAQAMSDAGIHPSEYAGSMMVVRTYPIRVAGNSGPGYGDQEETDWSEIGVEPEKTTVTKKIRRVFTFSVQQFREALIANRPEYLFVNFMNYLPLNQHRGWLETNILRPYVQVMGAPPKLVLLGHGPKNDDVGVLT